MARVGDFLERAASYDSDLIGKRAGYNGPPGYRSIWIDGEGYLVHRLIWLLVAGKFPVNESYLQHQYRTRKYSRQENLREAAPSPNMQNKRPVSGFSLKGAQWNKRDRKWVAQAALDNRKTTYLGSFDTEEEAHALPNMSSKEVLSEFFSKCH